VAAPPGLRPPGRSPATIARLHRVSSWSPTFLKPARLDDTVAVSVHLESLGKVRCIFAQEIRRDDDVLVKAKVTVACVTGRGLQTR
jgi:acyl-CoA thioesterase FadM